MSVSPLKMSIEGGGLTSCSQLHSLPSSCHPSEPACTISTGISDQTSRQVLHDHEPFLVGSSLDQHAKIEQVHTDLQRSINGECIDEQGKMHSIGDLSIQDYAKIGVKDGNKNGSSTWLGSSSDPVVTPMVSVPSASNRPSKKLLNLWRTKLENEEEEEEEKEGKTEKQRNIIGNRKQGNADKNSKIKKTRNINSILDGQAIIPITDGVKGKKNVFKVGTVEKYGKLNMESNPKAITMSRNFNLTIEYEAKETGKRGRPKKVNGPSSYGNSRSSGEQKAKRGRPKKVKDQIFSATKDGEAPTRKKGRPKKAKDQLVDEQENGNKQEQKKKTSKVTLHPVNENENGGGQRRKRGRPKKVKDELVNGNECESEGKQKGLSANKVKDQLINDKTEEKTKLKSGRPEKVKNQMDDDMCVENLKQRKRKKCYYNYSKCCYIFG